MKSVSRVVFGILFLLCSQHVSRGSHIMASDLGFKSLGGSKYQVVLKLYRDCRGLPLTPDIDSLYCYSGNSGSVSNPICRLKWTRISIKDVTPLCKDSVSHCNPDSGGLGPGIEEHIFVADIDLMQSPFSTVGLGSTYCELTVAFNSCCRNGAITTGSAINDFWTRSTLNICNMNRCSSKQNSTVHFTSIPVIEAYCNSPVRYYHGELDTTDFDSIAYALAPGLKGVADVSVSYSSPFSYKYPVTPYCVPSGVSCTPNPKTNPPRGFYFDTLNGAMIYTPTKCDEVAVISVIASDYRLDSTGTWVLLSSVRREMQTEVMEQDYNNPPVITGPIVNQVCEGDKICFDISVTDQTFTPYQTVPDTVQLSWNHGIPGATFVIKNPTDREKTAQFCWQTRPGDGSAVAYSFTVTATDDHCPKPAHAILGFKVKVNPRAYDQREYHCIDTAMVSMGARPPFNFLGPAQFKWSVRDSNGLNESFFATVKDTFAPIPYYGRFIIIHTVNNTMNCPTIYRDTVICYDNINATKRVSHHAISVYPNPIQAGNRLTLSGITKGEFELLDPIGRAVLKGNFENDILVPSSMNPGIYYLRISKEQNQYLRILVSR